MAKPLRVKCKKCGSFVANVHVVDYAEGSDVTLAVEVNCNNRGCRGVIIEYLRIRGPGGKKELQKNILPYMK